MRPYHRTAHRQSSRRFLRMRYLFVIFLLGASLFFFSKTVAMQGVVASIERWVATHRAQHQTVALVKNPQKTASTPKEPEIQFEFYTALPNMTVDAETKT